MKKKTIKRKNILSVLAVCIMLMATLLTACSSSETAAAPAKEETLAVEASKEAEPVEEVKEDVAEPEVTEEAEPTEEVEATTEEVAEEPEIEPVVYDGIDMESTLPGVEWIGTFNGIIDEPKWIVFNDETNKKVIVENGQEVEFSYTDTLAIFIPTGHECYVDSLEDNHAYFFANNSIAGKGIRIYYEPTAGFNNGDKVNITQRVEFDGEELVLNATLVVKK